MGKTPKKELGIYIHIPFCIKKCTYCDFLSDKLENDNQLKEYCDLLSHELELMPEKGSRISSIFFGGGTPSLLDADIIEMLVNKINKNYIITNDCEITIESNPETLTLEKLAGYKSAGVNRISMGVQSFDDEVLKLIGRVHDSKTAMKAAELIARSNFASFNIDLMYALPGQSAKSAKNSAKTAVDLGANHISAYELILEEEASMYNLVESGKLILPCDNEIDCMCDEINYELKAGGFERYEISNYAKDGSFCKHNLGIWKGSEYISAGYGASSMLYDEKKQTIRYKNASYSDYESRILNKKWSGEIYDIVSAKDQMFEAVMLELRLISGIDIKEFKNRFGADIFDVYNEAISSNIKKGLLITDPEFGNIKLSESGLKFQNCVLLDFM